MAGEREEQPMSSHNTRFELEIFGFDGDCSLKNGRKVDETDTLKVANRQYP